MTDDTQLLHDYVKEGSEPAFRELVERHIQLVNSTAQRMVGGDVHLARDVTQLVFTDLARKAASIPDGVVLGGWLHRHTCFTASKTIRAERRRQARERTAMEMNSLYDNPGRDTQWSLLAPVLDDALNHLDAQDRDAIVLRYLQARDVRSIGVAIGSSENAAQKRIGRALEKLRSILTRRGITLSAALLATTLDAGAKTIVPPGLAASISAHALAGAAASTGFTLTTLYNMITSKFGLSIVSVVALAGISTALIAQNQSSAPTSAPVAANPTPASQAAAPAPAQQPVVVKLAPAPQSSNSASTPAPAQQLTRINSSGSMVGGSSVVSNGDGTVTITTYDNGVATTQTVPTPTNGNSIVSTSPNSGYAVYSSQGGAGGGGGGGFGGGSGSGSGSIQSNGDGTVTITKTENGVTSTETVPAQDVSSTISNSPNGGGGAFFGTGPMPSAPASGSGASYGSGSSNGSSTVSRSVVVNPADNTMTVTTNTNGNVSTIVLPANQAASGQIIVVPNGNTEDAAPTQPTNP